MVVKFMVGVDAFVYRSWRIYYLWVVVNSHSLSVVQALRFVFYWSHVLCFPIAAGALTGAVAGALAAKATKSGFIRGVSLCAIAGAILFVEVLEASRAYWCMEQTSSRGASSMVGDRFALDFPWFLFE